MIQSIYPPVDTNLIQALSLISKAKETSSEVIAVIPYMGYARQDREFLPGEIVTMKVSREIIQGSRRIKNYCSRYSQHDRVSNILKLRRKNVSAIPDLVRYIKKMSLKNPLVVSPDQGGKERAKEFAKELGSDYIALEKKRDRKTGKVQIKTKNLDEVANRDLILVDDMISTGGSIVKATQFLKKQKCKKVYVACTHALLMNDAEQKNQKSRSE